MATSNPDFNETVEKMSIYPTPPTEKVSAHKKAHSHIDEPTATTTEVRGEEVGRHAEWKKALEEDTRAERASLTGSSDDDIIRLLWDSFRPDTKDELATKDILDVLRVFGITEESAATASISDMMKIGRSSTPTRGRLNFAQFHTWWRDHGRKKVPAHMHSVHWFLDQLRHFYNKQVGSGSPVSVESLTLFLLGLHGSTAHTKGDAHAAATKVFHAMHWPLTLQLPFIDLVDALIANKKLIRQLVPSIDFGYGVQA